MAWEAVIWMATWLGFTFFATWLWSLTNALKDYRRRIEELEGVAWPIGTNWTEQGRSLVNKNQMGM